MKRDIPPHLSSLLIVVMSVALTAMQTTLPFKVKQLGGGFDAVGLLFMWTAFWYVLSGLFLGRISQHVGPRRAMLGALLICATAVAAMPWATKLWHVMALGQIYFVTICVFWAAAEHASTGQHARLSLVQSTAIYCVAFTIGNALGTLVSGFFQGQTLALPFFVSAGLTLVVFALVWLVVAPNAGVGHAESATAPAISATDRARLNRSLLAARVGLVAVYGGYALALVFLPRYLWEHLGLSKPLAGGYAGLTLLAMAATFAAHGLARGWTHKLGPVRVGPFLAAVGLLIVGTSVRPLIIATGAILIGVAAGTVYMHNLCYSLEDPRRRARNAGIHEAMVGLAFMIPPALSGLSARWTHDPRTIFWVGATLAVAIGLIQIVALLFHPGPSAVAVSDRTAAFPFPDGRR